MDVAEPPDGLGDALPSDPYGRGSLVDSLTRWAAEAQVDEAARARSRERWLRHQAAEDTSLASVIADLSERERAVLIHTSAGRRHRGQVTALGTDFIAIQTDTGADILIARHGVTAIRTQPREQQAHSGRFVKLELRLVDAIAAMAEDRPRVTIATGPNDTFNGDLMSVGIDVLTVRIDGDTRANVYIPTAAVVEIALAVA